MTDSVTVDPPDGRFAAVVQVPGDKSLSHRALIFAAMAEGQSTVTGLGPGEDIVSTKRIVETLGVEIVGETLVSPGIDHWREPAGPLDCGNSGTTMRLMAGALAPRPFATTLTGDASLTRRPMKRLVGPLRALGLEVGLSAAGTAPVSIGKAGGMRPADIAIPMASAQVRSAFSLAAVQGEGVSRVDSPPGFRDHTERWMEAMGLGEKETATRFAIHPGPVPPWRFEVPGDPSSAAFLWASAAISPGSTVTTPGISLNPGRIGFLQILEAMGAGIEAEVTGAMLGDPVGTVTVRGQGLNATEVTGTVAAAALDELPLVAILGAYAEGITVVRDAAELRAKESDRVASSVEMVRALGGGAEPAPDGFSILGTGWLESGTVKSHHDHRIAMAAAVAATRATGPVTVEGAGMADVSWPGFFDDLEATWSSR